LIKTKKYYLSKNARNLLDKEKDLKDVKRLKESKTK